ncbi:MAG: hypothetical protein LBE91_20715 [Tannerella sp.]|jgi:hypothetical protein|nr:hypothetical protein [Tannerella sp.]
MAMFEYGIGGNVEKIDASEAIADIPHNRTLLVEKLTADDPIHPEKVEKLETIEAVFGHYKPNIDVVFEDEEGQEVIENFRFKTVADFLIKNMTKSSPFLNGLDNQKAFYNKMLKQLRTNKIMQRALQNADAREAFVEVLQALLAEMEENDKVPAEA